VFDRTLECADLIV